MDKSVDKQQSNSLGGCTGKGWKPGESGNPAGRPKNKVYITEILRKLLEQDAGDGKTNAELIAEAMVKLASSPDARGHVPTVKELLDRLEGKVTQPVATEGEITLRVKYDE